MAKRTPRVQGDLLTYSTDQQEQSIVVGSTAWWQWLDASSTSSFRFEEAGARFTARREQKGGGLYWYAYRKQQGRLHKTYLGRSEELTAERLARAAHTLDQTYQASPTTDGELRLHKAETHATILAHLPLLTKLYVPQPRNELVARPRLYERLSQGIRQQLMLISAPAGSGKTTLFSAWRATQVEQLPLAWISLDAGDNDPARFWNYMVAALQGVLPGLGTQLTSLLQTAPNQWPPMEAILTALINEMLVIPENFVLALDDYHLISLPAIHESLTFLLEHQPPHMHLVLLSRTEPPLPLGRLRARGDFCELSAADLRFTPEEITTFLNRSMGLHLSHEEVVMLEERTEGWIAGLQLAALSLQGRRDTASFIASFTGSHHHVLEYLSAEVLAHQPLALRNFLLSTSLLERFNAPLCDAVLLRQDSQEMLALLAQANLFLIPLDEEHNWYRYHHLFAEFLRAQLDRQSPSLVHQLHQRAVNWYGEHGLMSEALDHAVAVEDFERVAQLIEQSGADLIRSGEMMTLLNWLLCCPLELIQERPRLAIYFAGASGSVGQIEVAEKWVREAQRALEKMKATSTSEADEVALLRQIEGELGAIRTFVVSARADVQGTIAAARETLSYLSSEDAFVRSLIGASLGQAYLLAGDLPRARETFRETRHYSESSHNTHALVVCVTCEGYILQFEGKPYAAEEVFQQALRLTGNVNEHLIPAISLAYTGMGALHYDWNNLERAIDYLRHGIEFGKHWGYMIMLSQAYSVLALALFTTGHTAQAIALFAEAEQLMRQYDCPKGLSWVQCMRARIWLLQGNLETALGWVQAAGFRVDDPLSYWTEYEHIVLARILLAQGHYAELLPFLERLSAHITSEGRYQDLMLVLILKALAYARQGEREEALPVLEEALRLGEPANSLRPFVDEGRSMLELLKFALTRGLLPDYVRRLLALFTAEGQTSASEHDLLLSEREQAVLRLLAAGRSNQQIAREFVVAISTIKTHLSNIYLKLGVHSRTQALARAKELHLI